MYDYTGNNWSQQNSNKRFKEKCGSHNGKTCNRFTTKDSYAWNITHNKVSEAGSVGTAVGSSDVENRPVTRDEIIIIIIIVLSQQPCGY